MLEGRVAPEKIAQKLVLIGTSAVGLNDIKTTPVSRRDARRRNPRPGAGKHADQAHAVAAELRRSRLEVFAALVLGLLVIVFAPMFGRSRWLSSARCSLRC